jgi:hypothetical protein
MPIRTWNILLLHCWAVIVMQLGFGSTTLATADDTTCREVRESSGVNYWFWQGYQGVEDMIDEGPAVTGHLSPDPGICLRVLRSELHEPSARTQGYKLAVLEWFKRLPMALEQWETDPEGFTARQHLRALTGQDFSSRQQWTEWWAENNEYLFWSDTVGRLIVDEKGKLARTPVTEKVGGITATHYWFLQAREWLKDVRDDGEFISGQGWTEHGYIKFRVPKSVLRDRAAKEEGYKEAVKGYIVGGVALPGLKDETAEKFIVRLRELTGEEFLGREEWVQWWEENKDSLVLSEDGQRLIVGAR